MGGKGSGRPVGADTLVKQSYEKKVPIADTGDEIFIPNYSGVKKADDTLKARGYTAGSVLFSDGENIVEDNSNLFWDDANNRLEPNLIKITSDGSQASPALKFNDTNTGFFKSGDSVRLSLNNSTKMTIDSTGVGIGTTAPAADLQIGDFSSATTRVLKLVSTGSGGDMGIKIREATDAYGYTLQYDAGTNNFFILRHQNDETGIHALDIIRTTGFTGINVADPHSMLEVAGAISSATATITASSDTTDVSGINTLFVDITGDIVLGGLVGGVNGQSLNIVMLGNFVNHVRLEHAEGIGGATQDFINHTGVDEDISHGGSIYVCNGTNWYDTSHAKHV